MGKKLRVTVLCLMVVVGTFFGGSVTFAYSIWAQGGFSPKGAYFKMDNNFEDDSKTAFQNGCSQWNNANCGFVVGKGVNETPNIGLFVKNDTNEVSRINIETTDYLMATYDTQWFGIPWVSFTLHEVDINVNMYYGSVFANDGNPDKFDVGSAFTHEQGHAVGLDESSVIDATMYGFMDYGETKKRDIENDDRDGLNAIY